MPVCDLGEVRTTVRTSDCCVSYECTCDQTKCPTAKEDCPEGYVLTVSTNSVCYYMTVLLISDVATFTEENS